MVGPLLMIAGGGGLGMLGLWQSDVARRGLDAVGAPARRGARTRRRMLGITVGGVLSLGLLLLLPLLGVQGVLRTLGLLLAGLMLLFWAVVVPRLPQLRESRRSRAMLRALPAAITEWRIAASAGETLPTVMRRYVLVPRPERAALQAVVLAALQMIERGERHMVTDPQTGHTESLPLLLRDALMLAARQAGCQDVTATMAIIATADQEGGLINAVEPLTQHAAMIRQVVEAALDQLVAQRALLLIAASAPAVIGALVLILFVAAAGGTVAL